MKIEQQPRDDHQVTLIVDVEQDRMEASKRRAARKLAERGKIPGFRPGKAPYDVIRRYYGDAAIVEEALELLVDQIYPEVLQEAGIEPAAAGSLENVDSLEPPKLTFVVPLQPTIDLGDYRKVRIPYEFQVPDEDKVNEAIEDLRRMYGQTETVDRPIEEGDFVLLDVSGVSAKAEEGDAPLAERSGYAAYVRPEDKDDEWPFMGFARKLIGMKPGDEKSISHKYSKDFSDEELAGQNVKFTARIKTVRATALPELNDDFAKQVGLESVEALRQVITQNIEQESRSTYDDEYFEKLIEKIKEGATLKYPPQVVDHEVEHVMEDLERRLADQGMEMDQYLKMRQTTREQFIEDEARQTAILRLERGMIMDEMVKAEKVEIKNEEIEQEYMSMMGELQYQGMDLSQTKGGRKGQQQIAQAVAMQSANRLLTRRVLDRMKAIATGEVEKEEKAAKKAAKKAEAEAKAAESEEKTPETEAKPKAKKAAPKTKAAAGDQPAADAKKPAAKKSPAKKKTDEAAE